MIKPKLITPPEQVPVTLEDVKRHARVFFSDDDAYLDSLIKAAVSYFDGYGGTLNRCIMPQTWQTAHARFCHRMETLFTDATAVVVTYRDIEGQTQTIDNTGGAAYRVYPDYIEFVNGFDYPATECRSDAIILESTHGYAVVPESLLLAIKILVTHWYRNREPVTFGGMPGKIPFSVDALIAPCRWAF
jgi:uncharacterized phiE125 gp8 family phage protein